MRNAIASIRDVHRARHALENMKANGIVVPHGNRIHVLSPQSLLYVESHSLCKIS